MGFRGSGAQEYVEDPTKRIGWACEEWKCGVKWNATHGSELEERAYIYQEHGDYGTRK